MLLIKYKGIIPATIPLPASFKLLAGETYIFGEGDISAYKNQQVTEYNIREITDSSLIAQLNLNNYTIHTDGTVRLYGTGENWLSNPLVGADLSTFMLGAKYIAKLNAANNFNVQFNSLSSNESALEKSTWTQQLAEATAYIANNNAPTPLLTALAAARNLTVAQYAQNVVNAHASYTAKVNALAVNLKTQYQTIDDAQTPQDLKNTGWI
jgi:hypothetical protein